MNRLFVSGDTHQVDVVTRFSFVNFPTGRELDRDDFVTILGDWGVIWSQAEDRNEKYILDWMAARPFSWFIILGNHENYDRLYNEFPFVYDEKLGGNVIKPRENIYIAETGDAYNLCGKRILAINGAESYDVTDGILDPETDPDWRIKAKQMAKQNKMFRVKGISWWPEEVPDDSQRFHIYTNIRDIDYIFSHDCPSSIVEKFEYEDYKPSEFNEWLQDFWTTYEFKRKGVKWFFGHHHVNKFFEDFTCLYTDIIELI